MNKRTTVVFLLAVVLLGAFIVLVERKAETTEERETRARLAFRVDPDKITFLRVKTDDYEVECVRQQDGWVIRKPLQTRANDGAIERILYRLERLEKGEVITSKEREERQLTLTDYGLEEPRARLTIGAEGARHTLLIGRESPLGGALYVKREAEKDILAVSPELLEVLPSEVNELRDRALIPGERERVYRVGIRRAGGYIQFARDEKGRWTVQQPVEGRADRIALVKLLDQLFALRVQTFVADGVGDPAAYGLADAESQLTLWTDENAAGRTLLLGRALENNQEYCYAKWDDVDSVFAVDARARRFLDVDLASLRDKKLMPFLPFEIASISINEHERIIRLERQEDDTWRLVEPREEHADRQRVQLLIDTWMRVDIQSFYDNAATNLAAYGLEPPKTVLMFGRRGAAKSAEGEPAADRNTVGVWLGGRSGDDGTVFAKVTTEGFVSSVDSEILETLSVDPLFFRDRTVLAVDRDSVLRIALARGGQEQVVVREHPGAAFSVLRPAGGMLRMEALATILESVGHLQAVGFVAEDVEDLAPYGLLEPRTEVTFGLTGEAGISRAVLLGKELGDTVYAMIRGQDVVFQIDKAAADLLVQDLVSASPTEEIQPGDIEQE